MLDEIGVDDGVEEEVILAVVHMVIHVIVAPSCPVLEVELVVASATRLELRLRHSDRLPVGTLTAKVRMIRGRAGTWRATLFYMASVRHWDGRSRE